MKLPGVNEVKTPACLPIGVSAMGRYRCYSFLSILSIGVLVLLPTKEIAAEPSCRPGSNLCFGDGYDFAFDLFLTCNREIRKNESLVEARRPFDVRIEHLASKRQMDGYAIQNVQITVNGKTFLGGHMPSGDSDIFTTYDASFIETQNGSMRLNSWQEPYWTFSFEGGKNYACDERERRKSNISVSQQ